MVFQCLLINFFAAKQLNFNNIDQSFFNIENALFAAKQLNFNNRG
jgi:hypothetical protein